MHIVSAGCATHQVSKPLEYPAATDVAPISAVAAPNATAAYEAPGAAPPAPAALPEGTTPPATPFKNVPANMRTGLLGTAGGEASSLKEAADPNKQKIVLNFDKADVVEVTNQIFGDYLKQNYVIDPALRGQISMYLDGDYTKQELLRLITRAYNANNIDIVPQKGLYHIQSLQRSPSTQLAVADTLTLKEDRYGLKPVIIIYRLRYLDSNQAINTIKYFLTPGRTVGSDPHTNSLIMVEDTGNARTIIEILKTIDMNLLQEVGMEIVPLKALAPQVAAQNLEALMGRMELFKNSKIGSNVAVIPLEQLSGVLIMSQSPEFLKTARRWIEAMDVKGEEVGEQVYVHFIENGLARDIANIIGQIYGLTAGGADVGARERIVASTGVAEGWQRSYGGTAGTAGTSATSRGRFSQQPLGTSGGTRGTYGQQAFGQDTGSLGTSGASSSRRPFGTGSSQRGYATGVGTMAPGGRSVSAYSTPALAAGAGGPGAPAYTLTGQVTIIPDEVNNAIVIKANASDYAKIKATIQALDIIPRAVMIEVLLAEVTLNNDFEYGIEWFFKNKGMDLAGYEGRQSTMLNTNRGLKNLLDPTTAITSAGSGGLTFFWTTVSGDVRLLINLLSSETNVNILSNPTVLAMDNQEATIVVGGLEPILTQQSQNVASESTIVNNIEYEETGIILNVVPHINSGGLVRMEVDQTIRTVAKAAVESIGSPSFTERHVQTALLCQDGKTAIIGGIIQQQDDSGKSGIPYLKDVPIIAPIFSSTNKKTKRTELIVAITPHVVKHAENEVSREFLDKLKRLRQRIDTN
jgi:general secretion pathway protein D